jgi:hypothetical protein
LQIASYSLANKQKACEDLSIKIESDTNEANSSEKETTIKTQMVDKEKNEMELIQRDAENDLQNALPALR